MYATGRCSNMDSDEEVLVLALLIKRKYRRQRRYRKYWIHPLLISREKYGHYFTLYKELRENGAKFYNYFRMSLSSFDELHGLLKNDLLRQNTHLRNCISPEERLMITLR